MEWEFSVDQVVRGEVSYGLAEFRGDLAREVGANLGPMDAARFRQTFALIYDLCYALATGRSAREFIAGMSYDPPTAAFLESVAAHMESNAGMLGAILQRTIAGHVAHGASLDEALALTADEHQRLAAVVPTGIAA